MGVPVLTPIAFCANWFADKLRYCSMRSVLFLCLVMAGLHTAAQTTESIFYFRGSIGGKPVQYENPKPASHALLCCTDQFTVQGNDTLYTQRVEQARIYLSNYMGGEGVQLYIAQVYKEPSREPRAMWARRVLRTGRAQSARLATLPTGRADYTRYVRSGYELRWKDTASRSLYSSAVGPARVKISVTEVLRVNGRARGGFGNYNTVLVLQIEGSLCNEAGQVLPISGSLRIGIWEEAW